MQRIGTGYSNYFNKKYQRKGPLFQGKFKSKHVDGNDYLVYLSAYVNLNNEIHGLGSLAPKSSFSEYISPQTKDAVCAKEIILGQFKNHGEYALFARDSILETAQRRRQDALLDTILGDI